MEIRHPEQVPRSKVASWKHDLQTRRNKTASISLVLLPGDRTPRATCRLGQHTHSENAYRQRRSPFYGYIRAGIHQKVYLFPSFEDAFKWFDSVRDDRVSRQRRGERTNYDYMAVFAAPNARQPVGEPAWDEFPHFWDPGSPGRTRP